MFIQFLSILLPLGGFAWFAYNARQQRQYMLIVEQFVFSICICIFFLLCYQIRLYEQYPKPYVNAFHTIFVIPCVPYTHYVCLRLFKLPAPNSSTWGMLGCGILCLPSIIYNLTNPNAEIAHYSNNLNILTLSISPRLSIHLSILTLMAIIQIFWFQKRLWGLRKKLKEQQLRISKPAKWMFRSMMVIFALTIFGHLGGLDIDRQFYATFLMMAYSTAYCTWLIGMGFLVQKEVIVDREGNPGRISHDPVHTLVAGIRYLIEEQKVFTRQGLKLDDVAVMLGTNRTYLSAAINKHYGCTFPELINSQRVSEAKRLLREEPNTLISEVAERSGFSTSSVFGKSFRDATGMTAKEYRAQNAEG